jgi:hypothetical protein
VAGTRLTIDIDEHQGEGCRRGRVGRVDTKTTSGFVGWLGLVGARYALISGPPWTGSSARRGDVETTNRERG